MIEAHPFAWAFFVAFILVTSFTMLNLFIAVIIDSTQSSTAEDASRQRIDEHEATRAEVRALREEVRALTEALGAREGGTVPDGGGRDGGGPDVAGTR